MVRSVVALGSNLGDRLMALNGAIERLSALGTIRSLSALYETAPIGGPQQDSYYNAVAVLDTDLSATEMLAGLHAIEAQFDRVRQVRWGPRTLDLDLILHGDEVADTESLVVPHPRYRERRFVLEPLLDAWPAAHDPDGTALASIISDVIDQSLEQLEGIGWAGDRRFAGPGGGAPGNRGGRWVGGQMAALAAYSALVLIWGGQFRLTWLQTTGGVVAALGAIQMMASVRRLGPQTTPFPEPVANGALVGEGIYGLARHPMYGAVLMIAIGLAMLIASAAAVAAWPALTWFFVRKARHEELRLLLAYPGYVAYRRHVRPRFVPWLV